ncbi:hypothetical protein KC352_g4 [Hortaea werneckii]|nr:hypothetical protein KC352_g4 [Hortaea werneckii]
MTVEEVLSPAGTVLAKLGNEKNEQPRCKFRCGRSRLHRHRFALADWVSVDCRGCVRLKPTLLSESAQALTSTPSVRRATLNTCRVLYFFPRTKPASIVHVDAVEQKGDVAPSNQWDRRCSKQCSIIESQLRGCGRDCSEQKLKEDIPLFCSLLHLPLECSWSLKNIGAAPSEYQQHSAERADCDYHGSKTFQEDYRKGLNTFILLALSVPFDRYASLQHAFVRDRVRIRKSTGHGK